MRSLALLLIVLAPVRVAAAERDASPLPPARFTLWQLPPQTGTQMMSYVLRTAGGKVLVIDGGNRGDAPYLRRFLADLGGRVEAWFITHPHSDHIDAVTEILSRPQGITIGAIYASMPERSWLARYAQEGDEGPTVDRFDKALEGAKKSISELGLGQVLVIDNLRVEVLAICNPEITVNAINNSSVVLKVWDPTKSVLFLGDLGREGGEELLRGLNRDKLKADYVQMAHHGQRGVRRDVYQAVGPSYCLWPTPRWLWENNAGKGKGSGTWETLEVRAWMETFSIKHHYVAADGLYRID